MTLSNVATPTFSQPLSSLTRIFHAQKEAFRLNPYPSLAQRRKNVKAIKRQVARYQDVLCDAVSRDFATRSAAETKMLDLLPTALQADHVHSQLRQWMRPSHRWPSLLMASNSLRVDYQPKGVVGIISPWNFPFYLALGPLITALAAGNRVMLKFAENLPASSAVMRKILGEIFDESEVAVFGDELQDPTAFTSLPFDHIVFTGSPRVGKLVMRAAADNLTPVTLELGGKSPAVITRGYSLSEAALRIVHGKTVNCGQVCLSPDYALVPRESVEEFVHEAKASFTKLIGERFHETRDYTALIDDRSLARISDVLADAARLGAKIIPCAPYDRARDGRRMPLHIVTNCTADMRILKEELFGPVLPIVPYDKLEDAIAFINTRERPLALYCFGHDRDARNSVLTNTQSGGVTINDWIWHAINHAAPFGGVGNSGMGSYTGIEGFRELSHARTVFKRHRFFPVGLFYAPYLNFVQNLTLKLFLGSPDKTV